MSPARLFVHRFRRPLSAAAAALAVLLATAVVRPPSPELVDVIVAAAHLPAGSVLTADDLATRGLPAEYVGPGDLTTMGDAIGRTVATSVDPGEAITRSRLVSPDAMADGMHAVPVRLADAEAADLLHPGTTVDLVLVGTGGPGSAGSVVAEGVRVVTVPRPAVSAGLGSAQRRAGSLIVVATDRRTAIALAAVGGQPGLGVVMR